MMEVFCVKFRGVDVWDFWSRYSWGQDIVFQDNYIYSEFLRVCAELFGEYHDSS